MAERILAHMESLDSHIAQQRLACSSVAVLGEKISDMTKHIEQMNINFNSVFCTLNQVASCQFMVQNTVHHCQQRVDNVMDKVSESHGRPQSSEPQSFASKVELLSSKMDRIDMLISTSMQSGTGQKHSETKCVGNESHDSDDGDASSCAAHLEPLDGNIGGSDSEQSVESDTDSICYSGVWEAFSKTLVHQQSMRRLVSDHCKDVVIILGRKKNINPACDGNEMHLLNKYRNLLSACPQWPRTALPREDFETHYGSMHRTHLWQRACNLFHGGTGDPLSKSDTYLRVFRAVLALRQEGAT